jgi:predicted enzyme related to lactoylglutathione lyase
MAVGDLGSMGLAADVGGAAIGVWQPGEHTGFGILGEPGAPSWFELHTRAYDASIAFYRSVFGWDTHEVGNTEDFRYTTLDEGDAQAAGIIDASAWLPEGVPSHWAVYFGTASTDDSVTQAVQLGATVVQAAEDTPYGRLASLTDPTGAMFKLHQPLG